MNEYLVLWKIDASADTPREAAEQARAAQTREGTTATVFTVILKNGKNKTEIDLSEPEPEPSHDGKRVPDLQMDVTGEYTGNAYPEQRPYRIGMTVLGTSEDYGLTVEDESGHVIGSMSLSNDEAEGVKDIGGRDHTLSGYQDDWALPKGMDRQITWTLPTDLDVDVTLNQAQIDEVREWLKFATGDEDWDWSDNNDTWEY